MYVKDPGNGVRYYRAGSAASQLTAADADAIDWDGVGILHVSGITAALSDTAAAFLDRAMTRARGAGVVVSFDVNHRAALWDAGIAGPVLAAFAGRADVVFVGRDEAEQLWGDPTADDVRARFPDVAELVVKDGDVGATAFTGPDAVFEPSLHVDVVDVVGAGDAFAGGYLAARLSGCGVAERLRAGHARAALTIATTADSVDEPLLTACFDRTAAERAEGGLR
jgi:2-dehydro-3-deoxygluconokinase